MFPGASRGTQMPKTSSCGGLSLSSEATAEGRSWSGPGVPNLLGRVPPPPWTVRQRLVGARHQAVCAPVGCQCVRGLSACAVSGAPMTYSFTEKKRIRKSFAKRAAVLDVPFLLATQINSYAEFLQAEVPADNRRDTGLQS